MENCLKDLKRLNDLDSNYMVTYRHICHRSSLISFHITACASIPSARFRFFSIVISIFCIFVYKSSVKKGAVDFLSKIYRNLALGIEAQAVLMSCYGIIFYCIVISSKPSSVTRLRYLYPASPGANCKLVLCGYFHKILSPGSVQPL